MVPPPPPQRNTCSNPAASRICFVWVNISTAPPWYDVIATAWASSWIAARATSSAPLSCPRWMTSHPRDWNMRRKIPIAASWPSNIAAAVTIRSGILPSDARMASSPEAPSSVLTMFFPIMRSAMRSSLTLRLLYSMNGISSEILCGDENSPKRL